MYRQARYRVVQASPKAFLYVIIGEHVANLAIVHRAMFNANLLMIHKAIIVMYEVRLARLAENAKANRRAMQIASRSNILL